MNANYTISKNIINSIINDYDRNNANVQPNVGGLEQNLLEVLNKKIAKDLLSGAGLDEVVEFHNDGICHLNDLSALPVKSHNCFQLDPRWIFKNGYTVNGDSSINVSSVPPKHLTSAMNIIVETMINITAEMSGGIGIACFNWLIAPFWRKADKDERRQSLQNFIFRLNQNLRTGSQLMFSSINISLECPKFLQEEYGEYKEEADDFIKELCELLIHGDGRGSCFRFPNTLFNITGADLENYPEIFELTAKWMTPYFINDKDVEFTTTMGCRSYLPSNYTNDPAKDCINAGNSVYTTVSLPMIALRSQEMNIDLMDLLEKVMEELYSYTLYRRRRITFLLENNIMPFLNQTGIDGEKLFDINRNTLVIGFLGLEECMEIQYGSGIVDNYDEANNLLDKINEKIKEFKERDGYRWGTFSPPSENACYRLAKKAVERYGLRKSKAKGTREAPFYTNGINLPVANQDIITQCEVECNMSPKARAGNINSIMLGEAFSSPSSLKSLTEKIRDNTESPFWAYTGAFSVCDKCNTVYHTDIDECVYCNASCTVWNRITGYSVPMKNWNAGKISESNERHYYDIKE